MKSTFLGQFFKYLCHAFSLDSLLLFIPKSFLPFWSIKLAIFLVSSALAAMKDLPRCFIV